ncbi:hypothetical protein VA7868_03040 [Vibrio aerogenes CECT 7868]|uniref:Ferric siderophore reductase C-terminal domain-containing protein n=1 Tax=Vibrio aerogenes CECT 7868 TaxID=1216006 RepID=A0A1M5ZQ80_9VIBR|nr:siderophore ferric iron reductase [Vibrio aerogenes]SHI26279.1 hypothetical protein VA7868_03040 [Vibrio aerogenes CECT 7868]
MQSTQSQPFETLNQLCQSITPYLKGELTPSPRPRPDEYILSGTTEDLPVLQNLYQAVKNSSPEAGHGYWLIRCWTLLTWQPLYIVMTAIYGMQQLPDFTGFRQRYHHGSVAGFFLSSSQFERGEIEMLIERAANQLQPLLNHYQTQLDTLYRCRPGMTNQLFTDALFGCLMKLQHIDPRWHHQKILHQAGLWTEAMQLPSSALSTLRPGDSGTTRFIRRSCCLVFKTEQGSLCADCPKRNLS